MNPWPLTPGTETSPSPRKAQPVRVTHACAPTWACAGPKSMPKLPVKAKSSGTTQWTDALARLILPAAVTVPLASMTTGLPKLAVRLASRAVAGASTTGMFGPALRPIEPVTAKLGTNFTSRPAFCRKTMPPTGRLMPLALMPISDRLPLVICSVPSSVGSSPGRSTVALPVHWSP